MKLPHSVADRLTAIGDYLERLTGTQAIFFVLGLIVAYTALNILFHIVLK